MLYMSELINKLHIVLNMVKGFTVGYGSKTMSDGRMFIEYDNVKYLVQITKVDDQNRSAIDIIKNG